MPKPTDHDKTHLRNLAAIEARIDRIFKKAAEEAAKIGVSIKETLPDDRIFSFDDFPATKKQIERLMAALKESMEATIVNGVRSAWTLSNNKNNALASRIFGDRVSDLTKEQYKRYFSTNGAALDAFLQRQTQGLNLSDRVWKYTNMFKREIELGLDLGIRSGESAHQMSRSLRQYLQHPDKLFRRVRDKHGVLQLSKAAKDFHPGRGVYRSSYKNARRLAATETNIAYRTSDHLRWQQMDFVVGIEIKLSNNHTLNGVRFTDICDTLKGRYPKDFKFTGWHPLCRCHAVTILKTEEEMAEDTQRILSGGEPKKGSVNAVGDVPAAFKNWVEEHSDRIEMGGNLPYFIKDNKKRVDRILGIEPPEVKKTIQEIAQERHANRDAAAIQQAWNAKLTRDLFNQSERIGSYRDAELRDLMTLLEEDNALQYFDAFKHDYQLAKKYLRDKIDMDIALVREFLKDEANVENMKALAEALGIEAKTPMTFFEANELRGNPYYKSDSIYRVNCQTCVVAHELRRRGFDVQALGNTKGSWLEKLSMGTNHIWLDKNGKIPEKQIVGAEFNLFHSIDPSGKVHKKGWQKTAANRKQLISQLEDALKEDGRYHIDWTWNGQGRTLSGHIICVEKNDGVIRYYDPQNGQIISDFYSYINDIKLNRGINLLRVDNLRVKPDYAGHILTKAGATVTSGKSATSGIKGFSLKDRDKFKALQKEVKQTAEGYSKTLLYDKDVFYTHRMVINRDSLKNMIGHTYTSDELEAIRQLPGYISNLTNPRYDPLKISRPNIRKKIASGAVHFVEYDIEIEGKSYILKTKAIRNSHDRYLIEYPYFFREKK